MIKGLEHLSNERLKCWENFSAEKRWQRRDIIGINKIMHEERKDVES